MAENPLPDWRLLAPHRPVAAGEAAYVPRPTHGADEIARWILGGGSTILVTGPAGVGKSTELAQAAQVLLRSRVACLVCADRLANMRRATPDLIMRLVAWQLVTFARDQLGLAISSELESRAIFFDRSTEARLLREETTGESVVLAAVAEIARVSQQGRVAVFIDGLEKLLPGVPTREIFDALSQLPDSLDLVVVVPWHAVLAGGVEPVLRAGERLHRIAALDTEGSEGLVTAQFFDRLLARRLRGIDTLPVELEPLTRLGCTASGGIPRIFLQLIADAGTYARVKRGAAWPDDSDLREALADQQDSFRRALLPGDTDAIKTVVGTDGRELDVDRRVRLLAHGILLERTRGGKSLLEIHPLVAPAIMRP